MKETEIKEVAQRELMVGNFIEVMGVMRIVMGIVFREDLKNWFIQHSGDKAVEIPIPDGIEFSGNGILATKEWREWLGVDKRIFPKHIKYVHEIQNYCMFSFGINMMETLDYSKTPEIKAF